MAEDQQSSNVVAAAAAAADVSQQQQLSKLSISSIEGIMPVLEDEDEDEECLQVEGIEFVNYKNESQLDDIMRLVGTDLSEPYSIFTYRYFLHHWPNLCIIATSNGIPIGCIVCKIDEITTSEEGGSNGEEEDFVKPSYNDDDLDRMTTTTTSNNNNNKIVKSHTNNNVVEKVGYLGMLAVNKSYRGTGIGKSLSVRALERMRRFGCNSVVLETEACNKAAMRLYERLGFIREELLVKYYLNWGDAYRLRLWFS